jgi:adenosylcobinamide-GDP ribazoletransferase
MSLHRVSVYTRLRQEAAYAVVAVQFLTRLPVPALRSFRPSWMEASVAYFPFAGLLVGLISAAVWFAACGPWSPAIAAIMATCAGIAATGAFHEDGLADTADGLGGGQTREQRLLIMKDSRIGTYGIVTLIGALALKVAALALLSPMDGVYALISMHTLARVVPVVASAVVPYAGDVGVAKIAPVSPSRKRLMFAVVTGLLSLLLIPVLPGLHGLVAGALASSWVLWRARVLIGGQTGDVLGAAEQVFEVVWMLTLAGYTF